MLNMLLYFVFILPLFQTGWAHPGYLKCQKFATNRLKVGSTIMSMQIEAYADPSTDPSITLPSPPLVPGATISVHLSKLPVGAQIVLRSATTAGRSIGTFTGTATFSVAATDCDSQIYTPNSITESSYDLQWTLPPDYADDHLHGVDATDDIVFTMVISTGPKSYIKLASAQKPNPISTTPTSDPTKSPTPKASPTPTKSPTDTSSPAAGGSCGCCSNLCELTVPAGGDNNFKLSWLINKDAKLISISTKIPRNGWVGFGLSDKGLMPGSWAVVGKPTTATANDGPDVNEHILGDHVVKLTPLTNTDPTFTHASISQFAKDSTTTLAFTRGWNDAGDPQRRVFNIGTGLKNTVILAAGPTNEFGPKQHLYKTATDVNWWKGEFHDSRGVLRSTWVTAHGLLMVFAWGLLIPGGVFVAAHKKYLGLDSQGAWFRIHRAVQSISVLCILSGFIVIVVDYSHAELPHFAVTHARIGLTVSIIALLQPLNAVMRPHAPHGVGEAPTFARLSWELLHKTSGYLALLLAWFNILIAFDLSVFQSLSDAVQSAIQILFYVTAVSWSIVSVVVSVKKRRKMSLHPDSDDDGSTRRTRMECNVSGSPSNVDYKLLHHDDDMAD